MELLKVKLQKEVEAPYKEVGITSMGPYGMLLSVVKFNQLYNVRES